MGTKGSKKSKTYSQVISLYKVYLDTNILINQFLAERRLLNAKKRKEPIHLPPRLTEDKKISDMILNDDIILFTSEWTIMEYRSSLREIILKEKLIKYGYSANEYKEGRREIHLEECETEDIETAIKELRKGSTCKTFNIETNPISNLNEQGSDIVDTILFMQASKNDCDFFITRDEVFAKCIEKINLKCNKTEVITPKKYLKQWHIRKTKQN